MRPFPDVSHHQGLINWTDVRNMTDVAVIRAMHGGSVDKQFKRNRDHARARGFRLVVYYHYLYASNDVDEVAREFIALLADLRENETVCLDIEEGTGRQTHRVTRWQELVDLSILNRRSWIYSGDHFAQTHLDWDRVARGRVRWVARYSNKPPETSHDVWQYTSEGRLAGVKGNVDLNRYGGTSRTLATESLRPMRPPTPDPETTEDDMAKTYLVVADGLPTATWTPENGVFLRLKEPATVELLQGDGVTGPHWISPEEYNNLLRECGRE